MSIHNSNAYQIEELSLLVIETLWTRIDGEIMHSPVSWKSKLAIGALMVTAKRRASRVGLNDVTSAIVKS